MPRESLSGRFRAAKTPRTRAALLRLGALVLVLVVASLVAYHLGWFNYRRVLVQISHVRHAHDAFTFMVGFVVAYGIGTSVGFPALPFTVAAGALFGTLVGTALSWAGALIGAVIGYAVAATVGRDIVVRWLKRFKRVHGAVAQARDFRGILRLRLIPVIPLGTANFVVGLARAPLLDYLAATAIGVVPSLAIYTYFADSLVRGAAGGQRSAWISVIVASVLLLALTLVPTVVNRLTHSGARRRTAPHATRPATADQETGTVARHSRTS
jgi:uncharacterized membrane protein YdjX (TVP38/TMEM64 family)